MYWYFQFFYCINPFKRHMSSFLLDKCPFDIILVSDVSGVITNPYFVLLSSTWRPWEQLLRVLHLLCFICKAFSRSWRFGAPTRPKDYSALGQRSFRTSPMKVDGRCLKYEHGWSELCEYLYRLCKPFQKCTGFSLMQPMKTALEQFNFWLFWSPGKKPRNFAARTFGILVQTLFMFVL